MEISFGKIKLREIKGFVQLMFNCLLSGVNAEAMNIHFQLRSQGQKNPIITLQVFDSRFKGRKFMYSTGHSIETSFWDKRRNRAKPAPAKPYEDKLLKLNRYLDRLELMAIEFLGQRHHSSSIDRAELKKHLQSILVDEQEIKAQQHQKENDFFTIWASIIDTTKNPSGELITFGTKRSKTQTLNLIKEFCIDQKIKLSFEKINMEFYHLFDQFMRDKDLNGNTRGKHFKEMKAILREAEDRDFGVNRAFQKKSFKVIRTKPDNVYLNDEEIKKIFELKLSPAQEKLKDLFVMACFVGARHSDWYQIRKENIVTERGIEMLRLKQTKTGEIVHIPIHSAVRMIINKYNGEPPKVITNQKFNEALKTICQKADLGKVTIGKEVTEKWKEVSTHTARRSFATNAYLSRTMDVYQIMKCTGHKTESSFLRYLKLDGKDFAIQAADAKFFKDDSWSVMKVA